MVDRSILMVAFHYPPLLASSGWLRTAAFARYLPDYGWQPTVLTAHRRAYWAVAADHMAAVDSVKTHRAFALDAGRHLAIGGRYPLAFALPDRWVSWVPAAVAQGLRLIKRMRPAVIWSTYPIPSALLIGLALQRLTGLPWVVDLRDVMVDESYPERPAERRIFRWLERQAVRRAARVVLTTPGAAELYRRRYPEVPGDRFQVVLNGYDEREFEAVESALRCHDADSASSGNKISLLHSGLLSPVDRNPECFFRALANLKSRNPSLAQRLDILLRGTSGKEDYQQTTKALGIDGMVRFAPPVSYRQALAEMVGADGLLLFQGTSCNHAIPAKVFEYFRSGRPILALTDPAGDTAALLEREQAAVIANIDSVESIEAGLSSFCSAISNSSAPRIESVAASSYSRAALTGRLSVLLDAVAAG